MRIPRTKGAFDGFLLILLGLWGGLIPFVGPFTIAPLKPSSLTVLSNSSAAAFGSGVGSVAKAAKRSGRAEIISNSASLACRASGTAVAASIRWTPGFA